MPQLSLRISKNIDATQVDFQPVFVALHDAISKAPKMDISTCHAGVIQEEFSYIGLGDNKKTKMYLELYWMESPERTAMKKQLAHELMKILEELIVPQIEKQNLICIPRVRIADLGVLGQDYFISGR